MKNLSVGRIMPPIFLLILVGASLLTTGCGTLTGEAAAAPPHNEGDTVAAAVVEEAGVPVEVAPVETGSISLLLNYSGNLQAQKEVHLVPKVAGQVEQLLVEVGDQVKKGDPIAIIEDDVYAAQLKQTQGMLVEAKLNLQKMEEGARPEELAAARAALNIARAALNDVENIDDNERTSAALNLANAQSALEASSEELQLSLEQAQLNLESAQQDIENTTLVAPMDGTVMSVAAEEGEYVGSGVFITLADIDQPSVEVYLDETDLNSVGVGFQVEVIFDALPDDVFMGQVIQVDPALVTVQQVPMVRSVVQLDEASYANRRLCLSGLMPVWT